VNLRARIPNGTALGTDFTKDFTITSQEAGAFVAVTDISDLPATAQVGKPLTLFGTVEPPSASYQTISWMVLSGPALVSGKVLTASEAGTVNLRARISNGEALGEDFTKDFTVTVTVPQIGADYTINVSLWVNENDGNLLSFPSGAQTISKAAGQSVTFTVNSGSGYTGIEWYVDGDQTAADQNTFTFQAQSYPAAVYRVTVLLYKDGKPWSKSLPVTITD
jgi:endo-1,4-beta-xylanase